MLSLNMFSFIEPDKACPNYRMYGAKCTMGGNE